MEMEMRIAFSSHEEPLRNAPGEVTPPHHGAQQKHCVRDMQILRC